VGHAAITEEMGTLYKILIGKSQENRPLVKYKYKPHKDGEKV
jgi:hypothetical protein